MTAKGRKRHRESNRCSNPDQQPADHIRPAFAASFPVVFTGLSTESVDGPGRFIIAADCTGHGVPGAMISVVCNNALNRSMREYGVYSPGKLLDKTRELILEEFSKYQEDVNDGMDISLLLFDKKKMSISWSGANLPLWIIKNGEQVITELKGDKLPVGKHLRDYKYTEHEIAVSKGDQVYMTTDGYFDQFGGEKGKKLKSAALKQMIEQIAPQPATHQKDHLENAFEKWKGQHEQVDDVCVVGIRF